MSHPYQPGGIPAAFDVTADTLAMGHVRLTRDHVQPDVTHRQLLRRQVARTLAELLQAQQDVDPAYWRGAEQRFCPGQRVSFRYISTEDRFPYLVGTVLGTVNVPYSTVALEAFGVNVPPPSLPYGEVVVLIAASVDGLVLWREAIYVHDEHYYEREFGELPPLQSWPDGVRPHDYWIQHKGT